YSILSFLNELSNNTKVKAEPKGNGFKLESDEFDEIDLLIENYVALGKKYPVKTQSSLYLAKQNHLIFTQLLQMESTDYFFNEFYVPFYQKVMNEGMFENMQLFQLIPSKNDKHVALVKKNNKILVDFNKWF